MKTICLIACSASKADRPAAARDLYKGNLFRCSVEYAEANGWDWYVLSAKYLLVSPNVTLAPYNMTLSDRSAEGRRNWALWVAHALESRFHKEKEVRLVVLAGEQYCSFIELLSGRDGTRFHVERPLQGLGIGRQMQWLITATGEVEHAKDVIGGAALGSEASYA